MKDTLSSSMEDQRPVMVLDGSNGPEKGYPSMFGKNMMDHDKIKILNVFPVPEYMTVLVAEYDEPWFFSMRDFRHTGYPYFLAYVLKDGKPDIVPVTGANEEEELTPDLYSILVNRRKCCKCGKEMRIKAANSMLACDVTYHCDECGYMEEAWPDFPDNRMAEREARKKHIDLRNQAVSDDQVSQLLMKRVKKSEDNL